ncbi:hypothetical protein [uncultured Holdemanella sp.]|uniref:hypothetical protein n=1 Tax=uncultured Holdemanella sp. TaxID=1763549 RepID=UPI00258EE41C|nr:hypothetical protein [uncultured Holdemanella sp.]
MQINKNYKITCDDEKTMLISRFQEIGYIQAKEDVIPFIKDIRVLNIWSKEFFISLTNNLISNES